MKGMHKNFHISFLVTGLHSLGGSVPLKERAWLKIESDAIKFKKGTGLTDQKARRIVVKICQAIKFYAKASDPSEVTLSAKHFGAYFTEILALESVTLIEIFYTSDMHEDHGWDTQKNHQAKTWKCLIG